MSEQIKQLVRRFEAAFAAGDIATLKEIVAENIVDHCPPPGAKPGRTGLVDAVAMFRAGFPDLQIAVDRTIAEGDAVAVFGTITGTNTGPMMGIPATGQRAIFSYMDMFRIANGVIVETWHV